MEQGMSPSVSEQDYMKGMSPESAWSPVSKDWKPFTPPSTTGFWTMGSEGEVSRCSPPAAGPPKKRRKQLVTPGSP